MKNKIKEWTGNPIEVVIVYGDDWDAVYIDGELSFEGYSIGIRDLLHTLQGRQHEVKFQSGNTDWLEEKQFYPKLLNDCVLVK